MKSKILLSLLAFGMAASIASPVSAAHNGTMSPSEAIEKYNKYMDDYQRDELVKIRQYREKYKSIDGSLADQVIERAIWYMENGYMVYGHGVDSYRRNGIVDCSEFTKLVYGDFGFKMTEVARKYNSVGERVDGVYARKVNGKWQIQGADKLRPGDILTWWKKDENGKYIGHVAIFMGMLNGEPVVIGTRGDGNPTAIGIVNNFDYWWGEHFYTARRVLPEGAWTPGRTIPGHEAKDPVIPEKYVLPPQRKVEKP
ncbi:hypothetical protein [Effusibacillus consociatus]|uniref:NlpC/P60 domain-containing protein n=1 Tax=Effusibacillus consociatus TaxID=1117041 RepID=A0ABV9PXZ2_9BACL